MVLNFLYFVQIAGLLFLLWVFRREKSMKKKDINNAFNLYSTQLDQLEKEVLKEEIRTEKEKMDELRSNLEQELEPVKNQKMIEIEEQVESEKKERMDELNKEIKKLKDNAYEEISIEMDKMNLLKSNLKQDQVSMKKEKLAAVEEKESFCKEMRDEREKIDEAKSNLQQELESMEKEKMVELEQEIKKLKDSACDEISAEKEKMDKLKSDLMQELEITKKQKMAAIEGEAKFEKINRAAELEQELKKLKDNVYKEIRLEKEKTDEAKSNLQQKLESMKKEGFAVIKGEVKFEKMERMVELEQEIKKFEVKFALADKKNAEMIGEIKKVEEERDAAIEAKNKIEKN